MTMCAGKCGLAVMTVCREVWVSCSDYVCREVWVSCNDCVQGSVGEL